MSNSEEVKQIGVENLHVKRGEKYNFCFQKRGRINIAFGPKYILLTKLVSKLPVSTFLRN
jgi:hypothetical protein